MKNLIIIGAGHAAAEAVSSLRKLGWTDKITLIGDEGYQPYQRPPLSKGYYKDEIVVEKLAIRNPEFYQSMEIDLLLGVRVQAIDRDSTEVVVTGGERISYDELIIATGTRPRMLPVAGADLPDIHYLRTVDDVDGIKQKMTKGAKLLIVGAGYIGLEVAAAAIKQGVEVTVLEAMDRVLARVTSPIISQFYEHIHAAEGVNIRLLASLEKFERQGENTFAVLANGDTITFDCAIIGIGVIPNSELAEDAGLPCDNGILVDEFTRTADPHIYAIGDCSNHPSVLYGRSIRLESVPNAVAQAKTAASAICGGTAPYDQVPWFWSDQYDVKLQTAGLMQGYDQIVVRGETKKRKFSVFYLLQSQLIAMDAVNSPADFMVAKKMVAQKICPDVDMLIDIEVPLKRLMLANP